MHVHKHNLSKETKQLVLNFKKCDNIKFSMIIRKFGYFKVIFKNPYFYRVTIDEEEDRSRNKAVFACLGCILDENGGDRTDINKAVGAFSML